MQSIISQKKKLYETLLSFPPFYTLQEHQQSRKKQVGYWGQLIHNHCRQHNIINSSVSEIWNLPLLQDRSTPIPKKLSKQDTLTILRDLQKLGCVQFVIGSQKILISHFSPYQMADDMYRWAKQNYLLGDVQTLQFITQGQHTTPKQKFYKQPKEIILKVIDILEKQNKAARIQIGSDIGVKFLNYVYDCNNYIMFEGSKIQHYMQQNSYRKHKARLADIRMQITSFDFKNNPNHHHQDKKRKLLQKIRMDQINNENKHLENKIKAINNRTFQSIIQGVGGKQVDNDQQQEKLQIKQEMQDGEEVSCFIMTKQRKGAFSVSNKLKHKPIQPQTRMRSNSKNQQQPHPNTRYQNQTHRLIQNQQYFNQPQKNQNRKVIYKKTMILSSSQSCLLELSIMGKRLLVVAYMLGSDNYTINYLVPQKRSRELMKEYQGNLEELCGTISLQTIGNRYQNIRIGTKEASNTQSKNNFSADKDKDKLKMKIQNQFIKRNYYNTLLKSEQSNKQLNSSQSPYHNSQQNQQKVKALLDRLAIPKRYNPLRQSLTARQQVSQNRGKISFHGQSKTQQLQKKKTVENKQQSIKKKTIEKKDQEKKRTIEKKDQQKKKTIEQKEQQVQKKRKIQKKESQYEQSFQNPINLSKALSNKSRIVNNSRLSNSKPANQHNMKQSATDKYEQSFQKQNEQEQYAQSFNQSLVLSNKSGITQNNSGMVQNNSGISNKGRRSNMMASKVQPVQDNQQIVEEEVYGQSFQN